MPDLSRQFEETADPSSPSASIRVLGMTIPFGFFCPSSWALAEPVAVEPEAERFTERTGPGYPRLYYRIGAFPPLRGGQNAYPGLQKKLSSQKGLISGINSRL